MQDTADVNYMLLTVIWLLSLRTIALRTLSMQHVHNISMLCLSTYDDAVCVCVCVNTAVETNVLHYNVTVRQRTSPYAALCERSLRLETVLQANRIP